MCEKKVFDSEKQALKFGRGKVQGLCSHSNYGKSYRSRRNGRVRAYFCNVCKGYHLTKTKIREELNGSN